MGFRGYIIYLLSESEAISFLPPKRIWHCREKRVAEISHWDGHTKPPPGAFGVWGDPGPETLVAESGHPQALGVSPRSGMAGTPAFQRHLKEEALLPLACTEGSPTQRQR